MLCVKDHHLSHTLRSYAESHHLSHQLLVVCCCLVVWLGPEGRWGFGLAEGFYGSLLTAGQGRPCFQPQSLKDVFSVLSCLTLGLTAWCCVVKLCCVLASPLASPSVLSSLAGSCSNITCSCAKAPRFRSSLFANFELMSDWKLFSACNYYNENTRAIVFLYSSHYITLDSCLSAEGLNMIRVICFPTNHFFNYLLQLRQERPKKEMGETNVEYMFNKILQTTTNH